MIVDFFGVKVRVPSGFAQLPDGTFVRKTGYEYAMCQYGRGSDSVIVLEPIYALHLRCFVCEKVDADNRGR